jgi:hypothetical protein
MEPHLSAVDSAPTESAPMKQTGLAKLKSLSPCVEVNGHMLADVNGDEVEAYLLEAGGLHLTAAVADAPANWACDVHHHE